MGETVLINDPGSKVDANSTDMKNRKPYGMRRSEAAAMAAEMKIPNAGTMGLNDLMVAIEMQPKKPAKKPTKKAKK